MTALGGASDPIQIDDPTDDQQSDRTEQARSCFLAECDEGVESDYDDDAIGNASQSQQTVCMECVKGVRMEMCAICEELCKEFPCWVLSEERVRRMASLKTGAFPTRALLKWQN